MLRQQERKYTFAAAIMAKSAEQIKFRSIRRIGTNESLSTSDTIGPLNNINGVDQKVGKHCDMQELEKEVII